MGYCDAPRGRLDCPPGQPFPCADCPWWRDDEDNPWLEQAAEHEACALEGIYVPPPPGYPYGPYD